MKILIILALLTTGCANPLQSPAEKVADVILPEYQRYLENDSQISEASKKRRIDAAKSFIEAVNSGRR